MPPGYIRGISPAFAGLSPAPGQVAYVLLTRAPVAGSRVQALRSAAPRLACVKPAASVHPEPGSNSSLLLSCFFFFSKDRVGNIRRLTAGLTYLPRRQPHHEAVVSSGPSFEAAPSEARSETLLVVWMLFRW